jgi:uncharacterized protein with PQ loop repeat
MLKDLSSVAIGAFAISYFGLFCYIIFAMVSAG